MRSLIILFSTLMSLSSHAILNGKKFKSVVPDFIISYSLQADSGHCSGTMVHPKVMITAGHCRINNSSLGSVYVNGSNVSVTSIISEDANKDMWRGDGRESNKVGLSDASTDLMILVFSSPRRLNEIADLDIFDELASKATNSSGQIFAKGPSTTAMSRNSRGKRPVDFKTLYTDVRLQHSRGLLNLHHMDTKSSVCKGDSGGGIFLDGKLVGVLSGRGSVDLSKVASEVKKRAQENEKRARAGKEPKTYDNPAGYVATNINALCQRGHFTSYAAPLKPYMKSILSIIEAVDRGQNPKDLKLTRE